MGGHRARQTGSALIISLVILIVMTLIGITAMGGSSLQERMAGNSRDMAVSFQAAEAALRGGESWLRVDSNPFAAEATDPLPNPAAWDGDDATGKEERLTLPLADDPQYHVAAPQRVRIGIGLPAQYRFIHPVTARAVGGTDTSVSIVQSMYEP